VGSNEKFQATQAEVHCQIFQPGFTGVLILCSFNMQSCGPKKEHWLAAIDIHNYGGHAIWKVPTAKKLHGTKIEVLVSGLTYENLLKLACEMKPVSPK
jgi:hypothetical protein